MRISPTLFFLKSAPLVIILALLPWAYSIPLCLFITWGYQYIVALIYGLHVMPTMDMVCFFGNEKANVNFMSFTIVDKYPFEDAKARIQQFMKDKAKLRYRVKEVMGDLYWEDTTVDENIDYCFSRIPKECQSERDIEQLVNSDLNTTMPHDKPQWRMWWQDTYQEKYSIIIYKQHHSLCDGVSCMNYHVGQGDKFDMSALMPIRSISFFSRLILRASFLLYLPRVIWRLAMIKQDKNPLHDGKRNLSGKKLVGTSSDILFKDVKEASKKQNVTINDLITACLASGVKQYFEMKGDQKTNSMNIVIPANIRFSHYGTWDKVKFENKFAPVPLIIPLENNIEKSLEKVPKVTANLRHQFVDIYATYAMSFYFTMFAPYWLTNRVLLESTKPYTLAFSNTPGLLKPIEFSGRKSIKMQYYFIPSAQTGIAFSCLSYVDYFKITCVVDDSIMKDPQVLVDLVEKNIHHCLDFTRKPKSTDPYKDPVAEEKSEVLIGE